MNKRTAEIARKTAETDIKLSLDLNGRGESDVETGCGFLNHMLTLFAKHSRFALLKTHHQTNHKPNSSRLGYKAQSILFRSFP